MVSNKLSATCLELSCAASIASTFSSWLLVATWDASASGLKPPLKLLTLSTEKKASASLLLPWPTLTWLVLSTLTKSNPLSTPPSLPSLSTLSRPTLSSLCRPSRSWMLSPPTSAAWPNKPEPTVPRARKLSSRRSVLPALPRRPSMLKERSSLPRLLPKEMSAPMDSLSSKLFIYYRQEKRRITDEVNDRFGSFSFVLTLVA
mmetsp:Transcript_18404/g.45619  ORF Transcript_18404/g.45619 Transcript_18404/m.45619 type:complete len:203 (+) Transcript_18404:664-1272(+)